MMTKAIRGISPPGWWREPPSDRAPFLIIVVLHDSARSGFEA